MSIKLNLGDFIETEKNDKNVILYLTVQYFYVEVCERKIKDDMKYINVLLEIIEKGIFTPYCTSYNNIIFFIMLLGMVNVLDNVLFSNRISTSLNQLLFQSLYEN